jgi:hypothetical protein
MPTSCSSTQTTGLEPVGFRPTVAKSGNEQRSGPVSQGIFAALDAVVD